MNTQNQSNFIQSFNALNQVPAEAELERQELLDKRKSKWRSVLFLAATTIIGFGSYYAFKQTQQPFYLIVILCSVMTPLFYMLHKATMQERSLLKENIYKQKEDFLFEEKNLVALMSAILAHPASLEQANSSWLKNSFKNCCEAIKNKDRRYFNKYVYYLITTADGFEHSVETQQEKLATLQTLRDTVGRLSEKHEKEKVVSTPVKTTSLRESEVFVHTANTNEKSFSYSK